ncbi:hypothetical protein UPYG_G00060930 [Umbra pygmaea]|uniref:Uncharacterized protein n=1 Tax=Umbra pygmaea TaxID=75934 RepID=A0ABD0X9Y7_UMBPY
MATAIPTEEKLEIHQRAIMEDRLKIQLLAKQEEMLRAAKKGSVYLMQTNEVEERDRYRYQWRKEDRQRIISDRLELFVSIVAGGLMGVLSGSIHGVVLGAFTGFAVWFTTGMVRNWWSP